MPDGIVRTVVAVDPSITAGGDETGIVVACKDKEGHGYVLADYSMQGTPDQWAKQVIDAYDKHEADAIVVEVNQGGLMVSQTLKTVRQLLPIREVRATKGKAIRAEPISAMYEQGKIHHVGSGFAELENQLTTWTPEFGKSPDRLDALVWALTELMTRSNAATYLHSISISCSTCGYPNKMNATSCASCGSSLQK